MRSIFLFPFCLFLLVSNYPCLQSNCIDISRKDTNLVIQEDEEGLRIKTDTTEIFFNYDRIVRRMDWEKTHSEDSLALLKIYPSGGFFIDSNSENQDELQKKIMQLVAEGQLPFHVFWDKWLQKDYAQKRTWMESFEIQIQEWGRAIVEVVGLEVYQVTDPNVLCAYVRLSPNIGHSSIRHFGVRLIRNRHQKVKSIEIECVRPLGFES